MSRASRGRFEVPGSDGEVPGKGGFIAVAGEVVDQNLGVLTDIAIVDSASTASQEQKTIETLEQHGGRLVNGAKNSLAVLLELVQQIQNSPGSLRVQTRGRFIQEEKKSVLCS